LKYDVAIPISAMPGKKGKKTAKKKKR